MFIDDFDFEGISNTSTGYSASGYGDFTAQSASVAPGNTYTATILDATIGAAHLGAIYIDLEPRQRLR